MRFTIARLLALLAAGVALVTTFGVGQVALTAGRRILVDHEVVNLGDESNLRMHEIRDDLRRLAHEVRTLAASLRQVAGPRRSAAEVVGGDRFTAEIQDRFKVLLSSSDRDGLQPDVYQEVSILAINPEGVSKVIYAARRTDGKLSPPLDPSIPGLRTPTVSEIIPRIAEDVRQHPDRPVPTQYLSRVLPASEGRGAPTRPTLSIAAAMLGDAMPTAFVVVTIDFRALVRSRARYYPRHLIFLVDQEGKFLLHPDPKKEGTSITTERDERTAKQMWAFAPAWPPSRPERKKTEALLERSRGASIPEMALPELAYWHAKKSLDPRFVIENWEPLNARLMQQSAEDPSLRIRRLHEMDQNIRVSCTSREGLEAVERIVSDLEREKVGSSAPWGQPIRCEKFAAHLTLLRTSADPESDAFGLIVASALEEIVDDTTAATAWFWWCGIGLCVGAGGLALIPAWMLTRRLERLNRTAQQVAKGSFNTTDLPTGALGEVGELARSVRTMVEEVRQRDRALKANVARLETVLRTASEGIITFNERGVIEHFNLAAENMFGYTAQEVLGSKVHMLIRWPTSTVPSRSSSGAGDSISAFNAVMQAQADLTLGCRKDGKTFWLEVSFSEVPLGDQKMITGIFRDVTRRKEDEEMIRQMNGQLQELNRDLNVRVRVRTVELENANRDLQRAVEAAQAAKRATDTFVANMSHELRQPLNIIIGFTETIQEELDDEAKSQLAPDLEKILRAARHLLSLINDVLDYAKMASGVMKLEIKEFDVSTLVREAVQWSTQLLNGNTLVTDFAPDLAHMKADERRVRQVLINLLSNACKFTTNGTVTFRARREKVEDADWIVLAVADTGAGMSPEELQRLFQRFWQADSTTQRKHGGAGLGLTISKRLCELMGGSVSVTSEVGKGTEFIVRLPAVVEPERTAAGAPPSRTGPALYTDGLRPAQPGTVLVIDDDPAVRELMARFLTKEGFQVAHAGNAEEGLQLARNFGRP